MDCHSCGKPGAKSRCSRCKMAYYCGGECQREHWEAGHDRECGQETVVLRPPRPGEWKVEEEREKKVSIPKLPTPKLIESMARTVSPSEFLDDFPGRDGRSAGLRQLAAAAQQKLERTQIAYDMSREWSGDALRAIGMSEKGIQGVSDIMDRTLENSRPLFQSIDIFGEQPSDEERTKAFSAVMEGVEQAQTFGLVDLQGDLRMEANNEADTLAMISSIVAIPVRAWQVQAETEKNPYAGFKVSFTDDDEEEEEEEDEGPDFSNGRLEPSPGDPFIDFEKERAEQGDQTFRLAVTRSELAEAERLLEINWKRVGGEEDVERFAERLFIGQEPTLEPGSKVSVEYLMSWAGFIARKLTPGADTCVRNFLGEAEFLRFSKNKRRRRKQHRRDIGIVMGFIQSIARWFRKRGDHVRAVVVAKKAAILAAVTRRRTLAEALTLTLSTASYLFTLYMGYKYFTASTQQYRESADSMLKNMKDIADKRTTAGAHIDAAMSGLDTVEEDLQRAAAELTQTEVVESFFSDPAAFASRDIADQVAATVDITERLKEAGLEALRREAEPAVFDPAAFVGLFDDAKNQILTAEGPDQQLAAINQFRALMVSTGKEIVGKTAEEVAERGREIGEAVKLLTTDIRGNLTAAVEHIQGISENVRNIDDVKENLVRAAGAVTPTAMTLEWVVNKNWTMGIPSWIRKGALANRTSISFTAREYPELVQAMHTIVSPWENMEKWFGTVLRSGRVDRMKQQIAESWGESSLAAFQKIFSVLANNAALGMITILNFAGTVKIMQGMAFAVGGLLRTIGRLTEMFQRWAFFSEVPNASRKTFQELTKSYLDGQVRIKSEWEKGLEEMEKRGDTPAAWMKAYRKAIQWNRNISIYSAHIYNAIEGGYDTVYRSATWGFGVVQFWGVVVFQISFLFTHLTSALSIIFRALFYLEFPMPSLNFLKYIAVIAAATLPAVALTFYGFSFISSDPGWLAMRVCYMKLLRRYTWSAGWAGLSVVLYSKLSQRLVNLMAPGGTSIYLDILKEGGISPDTPNLYEEVPT